MATRARTVRTTLRGAALLQDPMLNKGSAFSHDERRALGVDGLFPHAVKEQGEQAERIMAAVRGLPEPLQKYAELAQLQDRNEHLFYRVLGDHIEELMPIVYTPTVGKACQQFSHVFRRGRGVWITPQHKGRIGEVLTDACNGREVRLMVVTDNEAILGIGDQGAGGMAISVGKLSLYVVGAGIPPQMTLPVSLDVGTDNQELLDDPMYMGVREPRLRGDAYRELVAEFVDAVKTVCPGALVQWEDFRKDNALEILDEYRAKVLSFNDDIQGTGAVALAGVLSGAKESGVPVADQRILIHGAGAAGLGIARQLRAGLRHQGMSKEQAAVAVALTDSRGLLVDDREFREVYKRDLAWPAAHAADMGLADAGNRGLAAVIEAWHPTVLIGASGQAGAFSEAIITAMAKHTPRPLVLPFSNPTSNCEAVPEDIIRWTDGRALVATGSPFDPVEHNGRTHYIGQGNNAFIFPGLGLGSLLAGSRVLTDAMIDAAAAALADATRDEERANGYLFPPINRLQAVSRDIAIAVLRQAIKDGSATHAPDDVVGTVEAAQWTPDYPEILPG